MNYTISTDNRIIHLDSFNGTDYHAIVSEIEIDDDGNVKVLNEFGTFYTTSEIGNLIGKTAEYKLRMSTYE